jgi:F-type H+/Na+-transporting ATPase subunit alpha
MAVEQQVLVIYAVTNGHLDDVPVNKVREWERGFLDYMSGQYPQVLERLRNEKALSKETEADLKRGVEAFKQVFGKGGEPKLTAKSL